MSSKYHHHQDMSYTFERKTYIRVGPYGTEDREYYRSATNGYFYAYGRKLGTETIDELYEVLNREWIEAEEKLDKQQETEPMGKKDKVTVRNQIIREKEELDSKIEKLTKFILSVDYMSLSLKQTSAMERQLSGMKHYSLGLRDRIMDITSQEAE